MTNPIQTRPPSAHEKKMKEKYAEAMAAQSELMDRLGQTLLTAQLAIPGLFATALKLVQGDNASPGPNPLLIITLILWTVSLGFTLWGLFPTRWKVNREILRKDPDQADGELGIEDFFHQSAKHKREIFVTSTVIFWIGIFCAALIIL